jgi:hypothetical protein
LHPFTSIFVYAFYFCTFVSEILCYYLFFFASFHLRKCRGKTRWDKETHQTVVGQKNIFFSFYRRLFGAEGDAMLDKLTTLRPCLVHPKKQKNFQDSLSYQILRHMHKVLNIDENKN